MEDSKIVKALIDENTDLEYYIKDKIIIGKPSQDDIETEGIAKLLLKSLNKFPDFVGQINVQTGEKTTFAEFKDRSIRCALWLKKHGIGEGDVICTSLPIQNNDYVPVLATLFIGATINAWPHALSSLSAEYFFKSVQPKVMFAWDEGIDTLVSAAKNAQVDCQFVVLGKHADYPSLNVLMAEQDQTEIDEFRHVEPKDPKKQVGALIFTSGTTNNPKIVMLSYETLVKNRIHYFCSTRSNFLTYSTFAWAVGLYYHLFCIRRLMTRILHSEFNAEETGAVIEKFKVNMAFIIPCELIKLYKSGVLKKYDFSKFETAVMSGCKVDSQILEASRKILPNTHLAVHYGFTEGAGMTIQTKKCKTKNSIGRIFGGVQLKIVDLKSGLLLGANQEGELYFKVDTTMIGYLNNPEATKDMIDEEGWLRSGDTGYYDENGEIWITDRLKQIIIYQGDNLSPSKIEELILQHPGVADVAVVPVPHEIDHERPFAFVVKKPGANVTSEELIELPARYDQLLRLTGGMKFINEIPYNSNGKKNVNDLKKMAQAYVEA